MLRFPDDVEAWHAWQRRRHPARRLRWRLPGRPGPPPLLITTAGTTGTADVLVAVESRSPTSVASLLSVVGHLPADRVGVLSRVPVRDLLPRLPDDGWREEPLAGRPLPPFAVAVAAGHAHAVGRLAWQRARDRSVPYLVVQHGALTPYAPPLPAGCLLLAWSDADADFWVSGRADLTSAVVGSQLLWHAAGAPAPPGTPGAPLTYLGQLHAAELPGRQLARAAEEFCREHGATYRPHPSEVDRASRFRHARWRRRGLDVADPTVDLAALPDGVVSVFSTGVLEATARGRDAWVHHPDPPPWLVVFWERYRMHRYGDDPTPAPVRPDVEPSSAVARLVEEYW
jgi:hypothetical protein